MNDNHTVSPQDAPFSRSVGSQSETPSIAWQSNSDFEVTGYQGYICRGRTITATKKFINLKFQYLWPYIERLDKKYSYIDIGCSAGSTGLQLLMKNANNVTFLDHDEEYTAIVKEITTTIITDQNYNVVTSTLGEYEKEHDVGIALAVIHWIYSYTEEHGSLHDVITKLQKHAKKMLIVEWVAENDRAIIEAGHIWQNPQLHKEPYNIYQFKKALKEHYRYVFKIGNVTDTRSLWLGTNLPLGQIILPYLKNIRTQLSMNLRITLGKIKTFLNTFKY